jgi:hypothetical protein
MDNILLSQNLYFLWSVLDGNKDNFLWSVLDGNKDSLSGFYIKIDIILRGNKFV